MANSLQKGRYTKYSNKIGLYSNTKGSFIKNDTDVVLNFPFKDTVLEGGMSKEDVGRDERFLHIELDSKDIDTLEEPKVLTDFRYIDKDGEKTLTKDSDIEFFDEDGELKQNLLIKGNNLLALYTLREKLAGKVKLIYIDPPYNTGNDGFKYNDNFNHSTWLTFMKNRLEVARELLRDDGVIFVQCDDNEQAYLKILMDDIEKLNFTNCITVKMNESKGLKNAHIEKRLPKSKEYILIYSKNNFLFNPQKIEKDKEELAGYIKYYNKQIINFEKDISLWKIENFSEPFEKRISNAEKLIYLVKPDNDIKIDLKENTFGKITNSRGVENYYFNDGKNILKVLFLSQNLHKYIGDLWLDISTININKEGGMQVFSNGQKPEKLIQRIIQISTQPGDIVLDYHLGSGTNAAVAHKMGRQYIGIEQMDYIEDIAKERLKKVIAGEQGGISKSVDWQGGGSFVYFELKKYNQEYVDLITKATSLSELEEIYVEMRNNAFLKFWFDRKDFEKDEDFRKLNLAERKKVLIDVLDENQLYLNYPDMNDARHNVTEDEKALTDIFYGSNKD